MCDSCRQTEECRCESWGKNCTFPDYVERVLFEHKLNVSVCAQNLYGYSACSDEVTYSDIWTIGK